MAFGFLIVVMVGVASADETPSSDPALPVELASAVVVAADADSLDTNAIGQLTVDTGGTIQRGTAFQLDDGRIGTVAHALVDAREARVGSERVDLTTATITRQHDLGTINDTVLNATMSVAGIDGVVGEIVAIGGVPPNGRIEVVTGEIILRTSGEGYGIGRPDVYVIDAPVERGWSGGPVVNADGDVIAIVVGYETVSGVTLAVPISYLPQ